MMSPPKLSATGRMRAVRAAKKYEYFAKRCEADSWLVGKLRNVQVN